MTAGTVALRVACAVFVLQSMAGIVNTPQVVRLQWRQLTVLRTFVTVLATIAGMATLALAGGGIVTVAAMGLAAAFLMVAGNLLLAVRFQPALLRPKFDGAMLRKLLAYGGALTVAGLAAVPLSTAERFFLAHDYSTTDVAYLAVALNLATILQVFPEQLTAPFLPGLARLEAAGRVEDLRALYKKGLTGVFLLVTPAMVLLCFIARPFLSLWAGPQYGVHSTSAFLITIAGVWCGCLAWLPVSYLLSSGRTKAIAWIKVAELVPYLAAAWFLTRWFGVIGAALAWSAMCVLESVLLFMVTQRVADLPWLPLPDRSLRSLAGPLVLGGAALLLTYVTSGLAIRLVWAAVLALAYGTATWWLILTRRERRGLTVLARNVLRRGKPLPTLARNVTHSPASTRAPRHARAYTPRHARVLPRWQVPITRNRLLRDCTLNRSCRSSL